jgi:glyoxylase-like metal-dependent hydrolase (beta-lactamase superfamily II)
MDIVPLLPGLHLIKPEFGQVYVWREGSELTLIDTGIPGSAEHIEAAFAELGYRPADLRRVVLTHWHGDHTGAAADVRAWGDVEVLAHEAEAAVIRGERPGAQFELTEAEKPLHQSLRQGAAPALPPCPVDRELRQGDTFGGEAEVIHTPGHTDGSMAIYLKRHKVLFTGDLVANSPQGLLLGPFNTDRELAKQSAERLRQVPAELVCFGHGDPTTKWGDVAIPDLLG